MLQETPRGGRSGTLSGLWVGLTEGAASTHGLREKGLSLCGACSWRKIICCPLSNYRTHHARTFFLHCKLTEMLKKSLNSFLSTSPMPYLHEEILNCSYNPLSPGVHLYEMK